MNRIRNFIHKALFPQTYSAIMEVTNKNFFDTLPSVHKAIHESDVLAIDGEFTGLHKEGIKINPYDSPEQRYQKLRQNSVDFLFVQFGLSAFRYDKAKKKHIAKSFNFYIFPRPFSRQAPDVRFSCQTSSLDFLLREGFDLNKVVREGISYLSPDTEQRLQDALSERHAQLSASNALSPAFASPMTEAGPLYKGPIEIPEEHKEFINNVGEKIEAFLRCDDKVLELMPCNGYLRKLIFQSQMTRFRGLVHLDSQTSNSAQSRQRHIVVTKVTGEDDFKLREEAKRAGEVKAIDDAVGFTKVINMISESGKTVVGHNMILDVLHVLHKFRCPLPADYEDFKSLCQCVFPRLIDTKLMASTHPFNNVIFNTTLGDLHKALDYSPFTRAEVEFAEGFDSYSSTNERLHEAGYDSYITGVCFLTMCDYLGKYQKPPPELPIPPTSPLIELFLNKLFLMRVFDINYMNLAGPDLVPDREHVFHLTFPKEWKSPEINHLFSPFGSVQMVWLDDTSAFVSLYNKNDADKVLNQLASSETYQIVSFAEHQRQKSILETPASANALKRKMPASDVDLPRGNEVKRKRKSSESDRFNPRHSITPIIEEEEEDSEEHKNGHKDEDNSTPAKRGKYGNGTNGKGDGREKLFEEEQSW